MSLALASQDGLEFQCEDLHRDGYIQGRNIPSSLIITSFCIRTLQATSEASHFDLLPCCSPRTRPAMAAHNNAHSLPSQPLPLSPILIVDVFFPGLTNISTALQQLLASNPNSYGRMLCIYGLAVFFGRYIKDFFGTLVATYFSSWLLRLLITYSDKQQL